MLTLIVDSGDYFVFFNQMLRDGLIIVPVQYDNISTRWRNHSN